MLRRAQAPLPNLDMLVVRRRLELDPSCARALRLEHEVPGCGRQNLPLTGVPAAEP